MTSEDDKRPDLHKQRAAEMFCIPESEVTPAQRQIAKSANFRDMYGTPSSTMLRKKRT